MQGFLLDLRYGLRMLLRAPGFSAVAVVTLALGIGANTAIFSVANALLLRPFPYGSSASLVTLWESSAARNLPFMYASPPNFAYWREHAKSFAGMAAVHARGVFLQTDNETTRLPAAQVSGGAFDLLQVSPRLGRGILAGDDRPGADPVVVLSHRLWQGRFAGDPEVLGRTVILNDLPHEVVGVMPPDFSFPPPIALEGPPPAEEAELWLPFGIEPQTASRGARYMTVIGRLRPGVSLEQAEQELASLSRRLEQEFPVTNAGWGTRVVPLDAKVLGELRSTVLVLLGAVAFVLLIACVNVANLLLARARGRQQEFAVRAALGASRGRLARQWTTEATLLALLGGAAGLLLASVMVDLMLLYGPRNIPRLHETSIDSAVLVFAFAVSLLTGLLVGVLPAVHGPVDSLMLRLREGRGTAGTGGGAGLRSALVSAEVALSLALLMGAGLLLRSLSQLHGVEKGFQEAGVLTLRLTLPQQKYAGDGPRVAAYQEMEQRLQSVSVVQAAGFTYDVPLGADRQGTSFQIEGQTAAEASQTNFAVVTPGYFRAMGTPLLQGRAFSEHDGPLSAPVALVNQAFVERFLQGRQTVGMRIALGMQDGVFREIVGVVAAVRHDQLQHDPSPGIYLPYAQLPWSASMSAVVRTRSDPAAALDAIRREVRAVETNAALYDVRTLQQVVSDSLARPRFVAFLLASFSWIALLLACAGTYGVVSYTVSLRVQEIGIRMALGARPAAIFGLIMRQGMLAAVLGLAAGVGLSLALGTVIQGFLFGVPYWDPLTLSLTAGLLLFVSMAACWIPARRAMRVDPMVALRQE